MKRIVTSALIAVVGLGGFFMRPLLSPRPLTSQWDGKNGWFKEGRYIGEGQLRSQLLYVEELELYLTLPPNQQKAPGSVWSNIRVIEGRVVSATLVQGVTPACRSQLQGSQLETGDFQVDFGC